MTATSGLVTEDPPNWRIVSLESGVLPIGRASTRDPTRCAKSSNLFLENSHLSKSHARLSIMNGQLYLEDMSSTFGTTWNNNLLVPRKKVAISEGDCIGFVLNRPSHVIRTLVDRMNNSSMIPLESLLNPRIQLIFRTASIDLEEKSLVLMPVKAPDSTIVFGKERTSSPKKVLNSHSDEEYDFGWSAVDDSDGPPIEEPYEREICVVTADKKELPKELSSLFPPVGTKRASRSPSLAEREVPQTQLNSNNLAADKVDGVSTISTEVLLVSSVTPDIACSNVFEENSGSEVHDSCQNLVEDSSEEDSISIVRDELCKNKNMVLEDKSCSKDEEYKGESDITTGGLTEHGNSHWETHSLSSVCSDVDSIECSVIERSGNRISSSDEEYNDSTVHNFSDQCQCDECAENVLDTSELSSQECSSADETENNSEEEPKHYLEYWVSDLRNPKFPIMSDEATTGGSCLDNVIGVQSRKRKLGELYLNENDEFAVEEAEEKVSKKARGNKVVKEVGKGLFYIMGTLLALVAYGGYLEKSGFQ